MPSVLSVSLGSSSRDKHVAITLAGRKFVIERRGTDGSLSRFGQMLLDADGRVDVLCVGGANLALHWAGRRYPLHAIDAIARRVRQTPVVDGSRVKDSLEREVVRWLQREGIADLRQANVLLVCATDRFGIADELRLMGARHVICGDLMFDVGLPIPLTFRAVDILAPLCLPLLGRLPFRWLYPTGQEQDEIRPKWSKWYQWADIIIGDFLIIRRYMPERLAGKLIVTNSTTAEDMRLLEERGVRGLVTTSLRVEGRSFGTNVLEGILVALSDKPADELAPDDLLALARTIGWEPELITLD